MHDALGMDNDLDSVVRQPKQEVSLDDLERLVRKRRAIDGNLSPHLPGWMSQRVGNGRPGDVIRVPLAKRPARRGKNYASDFDSRTTAHALQNRAVLTVHGHDLTAAARARLRDQLTSHHERFLVREGDPLAMLERR